MTFLEHPFKRGIQFHEILPLANIDPFSWLPQNGTGDGYDDREQSQGLLTLAMEKEAWNQDSVMRRSQIWPTHTFMWVSDPLLKRQHDLLSKLPLIIFLSLDVRSEAY